MALRAAAAEVERIADVPALGEIFRVAVHVAVRAVEAVAKDNRGGILRAVRHIQPARNDAFIFLFNRELFDMIGVFRKRRAAQQEHQQNTSIIRLLAEFKREEIHCPLAPEAEVQRLHTIRHTERRGDVHHGLSGFDRDACRQRRELWRIADLDIAAASPADGAPNGFRAVHLEVLESAYAAVAHVGDILHRRRIAVAPALGKIRVFLLIEALVVADNAVLAPQVAGDARLVFADGSDRYCNPI